jgi:hypothetical protein
VPWLSLISGIVSLVSSLTKYLSDKRLIDAGAAEGILQANTATLGVIEDARKGRDAMLAGDGDSAEWADRVRRKYTRRD